MGLRQIKKKLGVSGKYLIPTGDFFDGCPIYIGSSSPSKEVAGRYAKFMAQVLSRSSVLNTGDLYRAIFALQKSISEEMRN